MQLDRRQLLRGGVTLAGMIAIGGCRRPDVGPLAEQLVALAITPDSVAAVGRAYLDERPDSSEQRLAERLADDLGWSGDEAAEVLAERLVERIRGDFREARTVRVAGWMLSETEARWAALVALRSTP